MSPSRAPACRVARARRGARRRGFTLVELLVALTLAAILVGLVSSVFLAQNRFYGTVVRRSAVHDGARTILSFASAEIRNASPEGIRIADSLRFVTRIPSAVGIVCAVQGSRVDAYLPHGSAGLGEGTVTGYAIRALDESWSYYAANWNQLFRGSSRDVADACSARGMDTVDAGTDPFMKLQGPGNQPSPRPGPGSGILLYRDVEFRVDESELNEGTLALYRGTYEAELFELTSGLAEETGFAYRLRGEDDYVSAVAEEDLPRINSVRVVARAVSGDGAPGEPYQYELVQDIPLGNAR